VSAIRAADLPLPAEQAPAAATGRGGDARLAAGLAIVLALGLVALGARWIAPYAPEAYVATPLAAPSAAHLLGTDATGRDILSRLISGTSVSLVVGLSVALISTALACCAGLLGGLGERADGIVRGAADLLLTLPPLPLVILFAAYAGGSLVVVIATLSLTSWGASARVLHAQVQTELRRPNTEALRALGATPVRILLRHIAPATAPVVIARFVTAIAYAVVVQASLAFLGLGQPGVVSWGGMVHEAAQSPLILLSSAWLWWLLPPALATGVLVAGFALIGWSMEERTLPGLRR
jgi:peptide/nickel transport system permease protein